MNTSSPLTAAPAIRARIAAASRILLLTHVNPDGDAIGSALAMWHALAAFGRPATVVVTPSVPSYARWLPGADQIVNYAPGTALPPCDLAILVDTAELLRAGPIANDHAAALAALPTIVIDHHLTNSGEATVNLIDPSAASTCELLFDLLLALDVPISPACATALLLGIITDTQSFQISSAGPRSLRAAAALEELGAEKRRIVDAIYFDLPPASAALTGKIIGAMRVEDGVAWAVMDSAIYAEPGADENTSEEVTRIIQRLGGVAATALFKEREPGIVKISFRSRPGINVAALAQRWGGGGHAQAAGATLRMPLQHALDTVIPLLKRLAQ